MRRTWPPRPVLGLLLLAIVLTHVGLATAVADDNEGNRTVARCGEGFLEEIDGRRVLHLAGTPYAMGYQHGRLLRDEIAELTRFLLDEKASDLTLELGGLKIDPAAVIRTVAEGQRRFVPPRFFEELRGLADGSGVPLDDLVVCNFIPELFHCSGFALGESATGGGPLLHGRVLDYGTDWRLQEFAVVVVAEPEGRLPFVNVTYAGFIGSVTGMNLEHVSIGEMGGRGLGHWAGVPMAVLVRMALEESHSLEEAVAVFRDHPRTCEYYYVIADGETGRAAGLEASWHAFEVVAMGEPHPRLPEAVPDAVILSAGDRYDELVRRVRAGHGAIDPPAALRLMEPPVAMRSNLHCALFEPSSTRFWVANAAPDGSPAATQPYIEFVLKDLLGRVPEASGADLGPTPDDPSAVVEVPPIAGR